MTAVVIDDDLFLAHASPGHPESPERLLGIRAALATAAFATPVVTEAPEDAEDIDILAVHSENHLASVETMSAIGGGWFDADTYCGPQSAAAARRAAGAAKLAVEHAVAGRHAFALTRPPGHHATVERAMGFCLYNNVAVAARYAQNALGAQRIAIVDIDVHHGNGTQEIFYDDADVLYVSVHEWPFYPGTGDAEESGHGPGAGTTLNVPVRAGTSSDDWLAIVTDTLLPRVTAHEPDLVLVSAGFDAHDRDPLADLRVSTEAYAAVAGRIAELATRRPAATAWFLEGGYNPADLGASVAGVVAVLAG